MFTKLIFYYAVFFIKYNKHSLQKCLMLVLNSATLWLRKWCFQSNCIVMRISTFKILREAVQKKLTFLTNMSAKGFLPPSPLGINGHNEKRSFFFMYTNIYFFLKFQAFFPTPTKNLTFSERCCDPPPLSGHISV